MRSRRKLLPINESDNKGLFYYHRNLHPTCESISVVENKFCRYALDHNPSTYFCSNREDPNAWITITIPKNILITNYSLTNPTTISLYGPVNFTVTGKKGDQTVILDTVINSSLNTLSEVLTRPIKDVDFYSSLTLTQTSKSYSNGWEFRISTFDVFGYFLGDPPTCCKVIWINYYKFFRISMIYSLLL